MEVPGIALVFRVGPEAGDAVPLLVCVEGQLEANGVLDAAGKTHAGIGLFFHDAFSLCPSHHSIDAGFGQTPVLQV
jgi:hypothetical protein